MKIIDYTIFVHSSHTKLVEEVQEAIKDGWQPYGFMTVQGEYQYTTYTQVLVVYEEK